MSGLLPSSALMVHPATRRVLIASMLLLAVGRSAAALESDQFVLPPEPLQDVGSEAGELIWSAITTIVEQTNREIDEHLRRAAGAANDREREPWLEKARRLQSQDHLAEALYHRLGRGLPEARIETMLRARLEGSEDQSSIFRPRLVDSIFRTAPLVRPLLIAGLVPNVRIHGVYVGTDKLGHLLQQGYEYHEVYRAAERDGHGAAEALRRAVALGIGQEQGIYGNFPSGAYSNADLAANFAGLKFYLNLTRVVRIGDQALAPMLALDGGRWRPAAYTGDDFHGRLLEPFVSDHLSEACNPPRIDWLLRGGVEEQVRKLAPQWMEFHEIDPACEPARLRTMSTWCGEEYGHSGFDGVVTAVEVR